MIVDCDSCAARGPACSDCVVTVLLGPPEWLAEPTLLPAETAALAVLADSGLVPPLRLVAGGAEGGAPGVDGRAAG